ncbi:hypothetical protein CSOJ01_14752 [Colletotrichum sojae]|uniref:Uncharacterized protein n=1 Tax=Colletotrichum sojae TaxID=2175907 RepID=A0A8H6MJS7_9PEZI|nr:hypothetical protein CSOJ01_14752 [Colletotrichum sojae]
MLITASSQKLIVPKPTRSVLKSFIVTGRLSPLSPYTVLAVRCRDVFNRQETPGQDRLSPQSEAPPFGPRASASAAIVRGHKFGSQSAQHTQPAIRLHVSVATGKARVLPTAKETMRHGMNPTDIVAARCVYYQFGQRLPIYP